METAYVERSFPGENQWCGHACGQNPGGRLDAGLYYYYYCYYYYYYLGVVSGNPLRRQRKRFRIWTSAERKKRGI
jgi:hypothetical protein